MKCMKNCDIRTENDARLSNGNDAQHPNGNDSR